LEGICGFFIQLRGYSGYAFSFKAWYLKDKRLFLHEKGEEDALGSEKRIKKSKV
jgi:hypothetical protein